MALGVHRGTVPCITFALLNTDKLPRLPEGEGYVKMGVDGEERKEGKEAAFEEC